MFKNLFLRNAVKGWVMSTLGKLGIRNLLDTHPLSKIPVYATACTIIKATCKLVLKVGYNVAPLKKIDPHARKPGSATGERLLKRDRPIPFLEVKIPVDF